MRSFTLVEVLIVLVLMTAVMLLVCMAIDVHLRQMTISRTEVEEAQAARAVLNAIAGDIRNVIVQLRKTEASAAIVADEAETASAETAQETVIYGQMPGIYGDWNYIQIDTAKLPRGEMYASRQVRNASSLLSDRLSSGKTVLYYLVGESDTGKTEKGLYRRQLDRQATQYAINEGKETEYEEYDEVFAPEAVNIEFAYYEASSSEQESVSSSTSSGWLEYWDMDEMQTLPAAVQITLSVRRQSFAGQLLSFAGTSEPQIIVYSLIVPLEVSPAAAPAEDTENTEQ
ncbi:MAG: hypothetical protein LBT89_03015 [Planctomycetaceae bacterium]|jgi:type II secretory pathway component PulJ|nr:hypothetical protein [Planctomycetaceae bacterium]